MEACHQEDGPWNEAIIRKWGRGGGVGGVDTQEVGVLIRGSTVGIQ